MTLYQDLIGSKAGMPELPEKVPCGQETFAEMGFEDVWQDADVVNAIHWLRGIRALAIPECWRDLLPKRL